MPETTTEEKPKESFEDFSVRYAAAKRTVLAHAEFARWKVTSFRTLRTRDGAAWSCRLRFDGKLVGEACNGGYGGPDEIRIENKHTAAHASFDMLAALCVGCIEREGMVVDAMLTAAGK